MLYSVYLNFPCFISDKSKKGMEKMNNASSYEKVSRKFERAIWGSKVLVVFVGMLSTFTLLKTTVIPYFHYLSFSIIPQLWLSFRSWISPLYIYFVINFIIFVIAATSGFPNPLRNQQQSSASSSSSDDKTKKSLMDKNTNHDHVSHHGIISWRSFQILQQKKFIADEPWLETKETKVDDEDDEKKKNNRFTSNYNSNDEIVGEDDQASPPETNLDEYSTMEATWKAIMERQGKAVETRSSDDDDDDDEVKMDGEDHALERDIMRKWETLRKDKSISEEELNKRAEAFINKVNNDIRLQRLQSDQCFFDMLHRGL